MTEPISLPCTQNTGPRNTRLARRIRPYDLLTEKSRVYKFNSRQDLRIQKILSRRSRLAGTVSLTFLKHENSETIIESTPGIESTLSEDLKYNVFNALQKCLRFNAVNSQCPENQRYRGPAVQDERKFMTSTEFQNTASAAFHDRKKLPIRFESLQKALKQIGKQINYRLAVGIESSSPYLRIGTHFELSCTWQMATFNAFCCVTIDDSVFYEIIKAAKSWYPQALDFDDVLDARAIWKLTNGIGAPNDHRQIAPEVIDQESAAVTAQSSSANPKRSRRLQKNRCENVSNTSQKTSEQKSKKKSKRKSKPKL